MLGIFRRRTPPLPERQTREYRPRIDDHTRRRILAYLRDGGTWTEAAEDYGVSRRSVARIVKANKQRPVAADVDPMIGEAKRIVETMHKLDEANKARRQLLRSLRIEESNTPPSPPPPPQNAQDIMEEATLKVLTEMIEKGDEQVMEVLRRNALRRLRPPTESEQLIAGLEELKAVRSALRPDPQPSDSSWLRDLLEPIAQAFAERMGGTPAERASR